MSKRKRSYGKLINVIIYLLVGIYVGIEFGQLYIPYIRNAIDQGGPVVLESLLLLYVVIVATFYLAMTIQVIVHEGGHMIFGLLSGYKFLSFRIFSFMWIKTDGKISFKRMSLAGTAGQCLMSPPDMVDGKLPVLLYNFGGAIMNVIFSALFFGISLLVPSNSLFGGFLRIAAVLGIAMALTNGLPLQVGPVNNDGKNALSLMKDKDAARAFWIQLKVNEELAYGKRLKDMPEEWFEVPDDEGMKNGLIATLGVLAANRLVDERKFDEARELMNHLLQVGSGIVGLHRSLMVCDLLYIEAIGENRKSIISGLLTKEQLKLMKAMKTSISVLRTEYALDLLYYKDEAKAKKTKQKIEKLTAKYPYPVELTSEGELMKIAEEKADNTTEA